MAKRKSQGAGSTKTRRWNSRIHIFLAIGFLLLVFVPMFNKTPSSEVKQLATEAAVKFLYLVDNQEYDQSWAVSSGHMQAAVKKDEWNGQIAEIRGGVGAIVKRSRDDVTYLSGVGDMPEGEYVVITFVSEFKERKRVTESVTLVLDEKEGWLVAGYFLK